MEHNSHHRRERCGCSAPLLQSNARGAAVAGAADGDEVEVRRLLRLRCGGGMRRSGPNPVPRGLVRCSQAQRLNRGGGSGWAWLFCCSSAPAAAAAAFQSSPCWCWAVHRPCDTSHALMRWIRFITRSGGCGVCTPLTSLCMISHLVTTSTTSLTGPPLTTLFDQTHCSRHPHNLPFIDAQREASGHRPDDDTQAAPTSLTSSTPFAR